MGFLSHRKKDELFDQETETKMEELFKALDQETDPERKKRILEQIRQTQDNYKEERKKKHKWWFMK
ncbi:hypothetical protein JXQ70_06105 [bacterium]|nr:hypothetical protein [bacterium]